MTARGTPSRFLQSVLRNGVGRYVCQLQRLSLVFSKESPGSRGARSVPTYLPTVPTYLPLAGLQQGEPGLPGRQVSTYLHFFAFSASSNLLFVFAPSPPKKVNGAVKEEQINKKTAEEIAQLIQKMANQSGLEIIRIRKPFHTDNPSIQGQWHPFTNKRSVLNVASFERVKKTA
nr:PREDICTED: 39S ribosomal protein L43, mitochondrial [Latimeria chalumnae]|eukprot:XP_014352031.1 PREDICTED: 39S ribosomal protein L43, mitochondrial [Latimeria chalumnae]